MIAFADAIDTMTLDQLNAVCESLPTHYTERPAASVVDEIGCVRQWRDELACGARTTTTFDPLWRAACAEMNARDAYRFGSAETAYAYRRQAAAIILEAAAEKKKA